MASPSSTTAPSSTKQYSVQDLKAIGQACAGRLPPASAMQAMFLYELQRETESERLFNNILFRLADVKDDSEAQEKLIQAQEKRIKAVRKQVNELVEVYRQEQVGARMAKLENDVALLTQEMEIVKTHLQSIAQMLPEQSSTIADLQYRLGKTSEAVYLTGDTRAELATRVDQHEEQLNKQTDLIRCLTVQQAIMIEKQKTETAEHRVPQETRLPVRSIQGRPFELIIPRGYPLPSSKAKDKQKENRQPEQVNVTMTRPMHESKTFVAAKGLSHSMFADHDMEGI